MFAFIFLNSYFTSSLAIYLSHPSGLSCHRRKGQKKHFWAIDPWKSKSKITSNEKRIHFTACWTTTGKDQRFLAAIDGIFRIKKGQNKERDKAHAANKKTCLGLFVFTGFVTLSLMASFMPDDNSLLAGWCFIICSLGNIYCIFICSHRNTSRHDMQHEV